MTKIYDQHNAAFQHVSAFAIVKDGDLKMKIAFKFPKDGAGRLWCYVHFLGVPMVRAYAGGYGYDKRSAAVSYAVEKIAQEPDDPKLAEYQWYQMARLAEKEQIDALQLAFKNIGGKDWQNVLRDLGYSVFQSV